MARATVGSRGTDRMKELRTLAERKGGSGEEDRLRECADDYVALQMFKHSRGDEGLTWLLRRTADALLRICILPEGVQWRLDGMLPKGRRGRREG